MRFWVGTLSAGAAGILVGMGVGILLVEDKLKKEYEESTKSARRAFEAALIDAKTTRLVETPVATEEELIQLSEPLGDGTVQLTMDESDQLDLKADLTIVDGGKSENPYHRAVAETSPHLYASYAELEEEDYYEEDGRVKEQITMIFDNGVARFFNSGEEIEDAFDRVGGTIVDDMRAAVNDGNPVVWIRNNKTDVDYEVLFEQP